MGIGSGYGNEAVGRTGMAGQSTDLAGLKRFAKTLLQLDIQKTKMSPLVVKHPFTDSGIVGIQTPDGHLGIANLVESRRKI